ncbi:hypothetical protein DF185_17185 [Marinifilum breve]|uniref:PKD domain-containing protein n=1 Tax=Marinifilum breve TaxID=2184082 RepID=A0A2V3ZUH6_9BACT|nr:hypothetical protein [Marinifilum breve]PXX98062.1 hypothetical protein DF185_17185 [Marinifilum breve]
MKILTKISAFIFILGVFFACETDEDNLYSLDYIGAPTNVEAVFDITQDNSGLVSITPNAEGAQEFIIDFGDGSETETYKPGDVAEHVYTEGVYSVKIIATSINGKTSEFVQELNVTFKAPENLEVSITNDAQNPRIVSVTATADFATVFEVYFGDVEDEEPTMLMPGESVSHTYEAPGDYDVRIIAKSAGAVTTEYTETVNVPEASDPVNLPVDFESFTINYAFENFGGTTSSVIDNPDVSGINTSAKVAQSVKAAGAEVWAGSFLTLENPIDFSSNTTFKVKVWSPKAGAVVKLKVENLADGDIGFEVDATTTVANEWEELTFDFSAIDQANEYQKVVIFFDFGNNGDDSNYYFDDIKLVPASIPAFSSIEDFEGTAPTFTVFGNIADVEVVDNPDATGANITAKVAQLTKTAGSETWAGAFFEASSALDFDNYSMIKVRTWSPKSGIVVKLKLENADASITHEVDVNTTIANAWEELTYDFSDAPAADYVKVVIFFDFGNTGDDSVYYYDEIGLANEGGSGSAALSLQDFEGTAPEFTNFDGGNASVIDNPDVSGINTSSKVGQMVKNGGQTWGGAYFSLENPMDFATYKKVKMKVWSNKVGAKVLFKVENKDDSSVNYEVELTTTVANTWEELTYDYSGIDATKSYHNIVLIFDNGTTGDGSADFTYYFDDIELTN